MKFSKIKFLMVKKCFKCIIDCLALPVNARTMHIHLFMCMKSVSGRCLYLEDPELKLNVPLDCDDG